MSIPAAELLGAIALKDMIESLTTPVLKYKLVVCYLPGHIDQSTYIHALFFTQELNAMNSRLREASMECLHLTEQVMLILLACSITFLVGMADHPYDEDTLHASAPSSERSLTTIKTGILMCRHSQPELTAHTVFCSFWSPCVRLC